MLEDPQITLVEPSLFLQHLLIKNMEALDMKVKTIYTKGGDAFKHYELDDPDMLIIDHTLPDMLGIELAEKILKHNIYARIVLLIPDILNYETQNFIGRGVQATLVKPFDAESLQRVLIETVANV